MRPSGFREPYMTSDVMMPASPGDHISSRRAYPPRASNPPPVKMGT
jgi:hypothetical protein